MSSVADYVGRTVDVLAFQNQQSQRETLLTQALATVGNSGQLCTGIQKLAQRWLIEFFTDTGSLAFLPDRGCDFMGQLFRGELRTTLDATQAFFIAAAQVATNLRAEEDASTPTDEMFKTIQLDGITVSGDQLTIHVTLFSVAGDSRKVILPIGVRVW